MRTKQKQKKQSLVPTKAQRVAISHKDGPMLVLAGPGSGKTQVITQRVAYLIASHQISPSHILVITFSKEAALQMHARFSTLSQAKVSFSTFHALFFRILKEEGLYDAGSVLDQTEQRKIVQAILKQNQVENCMDRESLEQLIEEFPWFLQAYQEEKRRRRKLDFEDMIVECLQLLKNNAIILNKWQERYRYLLVDEFQDINDTQYEIVKLLAGKRQNLFVVGDDDQAIYGFRGAKPEFMITFQKEFPRSKRTLLHKNFRSGSKIVSCAGHLIRHNKRRLKKRIVAHRKESKEPVYAMAFLDKREEIPYVIATIKSFQESKTPICMEEIAILVRTNYWCREIGQKLEKNGIPYSADKEKLGVRVMTYHKAKGLEFEVVFLPYLEEGIVPHRRVLEESSKNKELLEEERRMFYVALTRAKDKLFLLYEEKNRKDSKKSSRFLKEVRLKKVNIPHQ